jgi:hypothetical protein
MIKFKHMFIDFKLKNKGLTHPLCTTTKHCSSSKAPHMVDLGNQSNVVGGAWLLTTTGYISIPDCLRFLSKHMSMVDQCPESSRLGQGRAPHSHVV